MADVTKIDYDTGAKTINAFAFAIDKGSPQNTRSATVFISLTNENDNKPKFTNSRYERTIGEDTPVNTLVFQIAATDVDGEDLTFKVLGTVPFGFQKGTG